MIAPGFIETSMTQRTSVSCLLYLTSNLDLTQEQKDKILSQITLKRFGTPEVSLFVCEQMNRVSLFTLENRKWHHWHYF